MQIEELYAKFLSKKIPNYFLIDDIDRIYKEKYKIKELVKEDFLELKEDPYVDFPNIIKCYQIDDETVLNNLYSDEEKESQQEFYEFLLNTYPDKEFKLKDQKIINIILESKDGKRISGYTLQGGMSKYIQKELVAFIGIEMENQQLDNVKFINYLNALDEIGYL
ncbi:hypothetical protein COJ46_19275 [Bacillus sp. AFS077874]|uniref:hypothetical protein n=1 Tax=unclassified Bacillus (in: firmicutes) TaxID=185979 RepID=UPI000BEDFED4|nr:MULTISPECIES: hypothetical protein [unclassified Bacillus (in: firmicutes)]PEC47334.1 hypothetical protein CON00_22130 [Bacillus sp. AFS096315]PFM76849.1 hypothetical protein COJ46_19275 [Bacillus sp. AFS077874]